MIRKDKVTTDRENDLLRVPTKLSAKLNLRQVTNSGGSQIVSGGSEKDTAEHTAKASSFKNQIPVLASQSIQSAATQ